LESRGSVLVTADSGRRDEETSRSRGVSSGQSGPHRDIVLVNAAAALYVAGRVDDLRAAMIVAGESIDSERGAREAHALASLGGCITNVI